MSKTRIFYWWLWWDDDAVDGDGNDANVTTDVELDVKIHNAQNLSGTSFTHISKDSRQMIRIKDEKTK